MQREQYKHVVLDKILKQKKQQEYEKKLNSTKMKIINDLEYIKKKSKNKSLFNIIKEKLF